MKSLSWIPKSLIPKPVWVLTLAVALVLTPAALADSQYRVLHNFYGHNGFPGPKGGNPVLFAVLAIDGSGRLYGPAAGGSGNKCFGPCGVIFEMSPEANGKWNESVAFNFDDPYTEGEPITALAIDGQGNLYGAAKGGPLGTTLIYELTSGSGGWMFKMIEDPGTDVALIPDASGNLYGFLGVGQYSNGGVGELLPGSNGWTLTEIYSFCLKPTCPDGSRPLVPLSWDTNGNLYGTTYEGGYSYPQCFCGVAFQLTLNSDGTWTYHRLHVFGSFPHDGRYPYGGLMVDASGDIYGTTTQGGPHENGTVFRLSQTQEGHWEETLVYGFPAGNKALAPGNNLVFDDVGNLYGTAGSLERCTSGGFGCGLVFKLTPRKIGMWKYSLVHQFKGPDGDFPNGLTMDSKGRLYGTTTTGGSYGVGVVFEITP